VQGLHILLDYFIDQDEDRRAGDLNFCSCYRDQGELVTRLSHFYRQADLSVSTLPHAGFHRLVNKGLLAVYCADAKVRRPREIRAAARRLISLGGAEGRLVYLFSWLYRRLSPGDGRSARRGEPAGL
jgi:tetraprenyl-beta-curcumene synthase